MVDAPCPHSNLKCRQKHAVVDELIVVVRGVSW